MVAVGRHVLPNEQALIETATPFWDWVSGDSAVSKYYGPFCGHPYNESSTIWGLYKGPVIFGNSPCRLPKLCAGVKAVCFMELCEEMARPGTTKSLGTTCGATARASGTVLLSAIPQSGLLSLVCEIG